MEGRELSVAHFVLGIGRRVNHFHDIAFGDQTGIDGVSMFEVLGEV